MIDTLKLLISESEYRIATDNQLIVQPAPMMAATGEQLGNYRLWDTPAGVSITGAKAYLNTDRFNLSIFPIVQQGRMMGTCCTVQFSVPKVYGAGTNFHSVGRQGTAAALRVVERQLQEAGVCTDLTGAKVSRLDTFRNVIADEPFPIYQPVFGLLQAKRTNKRDYGGTTFLWHNKAQEFCVYDKLAELKVQGHETAGLPENVIRFEHRLLNTRKVRTTLGISTVGDLVAGYDGLRDHYAEAMGKNLFRYAVEEVELMTARQLEWEMAQFRDLYGQHWLQRYMQAKGLERLLQLADIETLVAVVEKLASEGDRMKAWRLKRRLEQIRLDLAVLQPAPMSKRTVGQLYVELKEKVLLAA